MMWKLHAPVLLTASGGAVVGAGVQLAAAEAAQARLRDLVLHEVAQDRAGAAAGQVHVAVVAAAVVGVALDADHPQVRVWRSARPAPR